MSDEEKSPSPPRRPWVSVEQARRALREGDGSGVRVAVIDSGVEADHPALRKMRLRDSIGIVEEDGRIEIQSGEGFRCLWAWHGGGRDHPLCRAAGRGR